MLLRVKDNRSPSPQLQANDYFSGIEGIRRLLRAAGETLKL